MSQGIQQSGVMFVSSKTSPASELIFEEHLKTIISKTSAQPFLPGKNTKAARMMHSPFGDFPKSSMAKKEADIEAPEPIDNFATSIAIKGNSKYLDSPK